MTHNKSRLALSLLSGVAAVFFSQVAMAGVIDLEVKQAGGQTYLDIAANTVKCGNDLYCIKTNRGQSQDLEFRLKQACQPNGPEYGLSGMQFSQIQREPDSSGQMVKAFGKYVIPAVVAQDFDTDARGNVLFTLPNKLDKHMIKLKNKNDGEYVVFFIIEATHCENPNIKIYLDPRVENTGR